MQVTKIPQSRRVMSAILAGVVGAVTLMPSAAFAEDAADSGKKAVPTIPAPAEKAEATPAEGDVKKEEAAAEETDGKKEVPTIPAPSAPANETAPAEAPAATDAPAETAPAETAPADAAPAATDTAATETAGTEAAASTPAADAAAEEEEEHEEEDWTWMTVAGWSGVGLGVLSGMVGVVTLATPSDPQRDTLGWGATGAGMGLLLVGGTMLYLDNEARSE